MEENELKSLLEWMEKLIVKPVSDNVDKLSRSVDKLTQTVIKLQIDFKELKTKGFFASKLWNRVGDVVMLVVGYLIANILASYYRSGGSG